MQTAQFPKTTKAQWMPPTAKIISNFIKFSKPAMLASRIYDKEPEEKLNPANTFEHTTITHLLHKS